MRARGFVVPPAVAVAILVATPRAQAMPAKEFIALYDKGNHEARLMLEGMAQSMEQSFMWTNAYLEAHGQKPIYCEPGKLKLTDGQVIEMIRDQSKTVKFENAPTEAALLYDFIDTFPCGKN